MTAMHAAFTAVIVGLTAVATSFSAAAVRPGLNACSVSCIKERDACLAKLGDVAEGSCGDGFRICVQRCDPRTQNTAALDAAEERDQQRAQGLTVADPVLDQSTGHLRSIYNDQQREFLHCTDRCDTSAMLCGRHGQPTEECRLGREACLERCGPDPFRNTPAPTPGAPAERILPKP